MHPFRTLIGTFALGLLLASTGCYYDVESELYPNNFCDTTNVTFSATIQPIIQNNCAVPGCHASGTGNPDLTTYAGIAERASDGSLRTVAVDLRTMPPSPSSPLRECDVTKLRIWLAAGHPNN
jgi:hypothetical protein